MFEKKEFAIFLIKYLSLNNKPLSIPDNKMVCLNDDLRDNNFCLYNSYLYNKMVCLDDNFDDNKFCSYNKLIWQEYKEQTMPEGIIRSRYNDFLKTRGKKKITQKR